MKHPSAEDRSNRLVACSPRKFQPRQSFVHFLAEYRRNYLTRAQLGRSETGSGAPRLEQRIRNGCSEPSVHVLQHRLPLPLELGWRRGTGAKGLLAALSVPAPHQVGDAPSLLASQSDESSLCGLDPSRSPQTYRYLQNVILVPCPRNVAHKSAALSAVCCVGLPRKTPGIPELESLAYGAHGSQTCTPNFEDRTLGRRYFKMGLSVILERMRFYLWAGRE